MEGSANIEVGIIDYNGTDTGTYSFTSTFTTVPTVTATAVESDPDVSPGNVNVFIDSISLTQVVVRVSQTNYVGKVHVQIISAS